MEFTWSRNCTVAIDSLQLITPFHRVMPDYREATRLLWRQAWTQGFQRIAIIRSDSLHPITEDRAIAGFLLEQFRHPLAAEIPIFNFPGGKNTRTAFKAWLQTHRPQIILHSSALTRTLAQLTPGHGVRCLAFNTLSSTEPGMGANYFEVGRRAVEQVVTLMQTNQLGLPVSATCTYIPPIRPG